MQPSKTIELTFIFFNSVRALVPAAGALRLPCNTAFACAADPARSARARAIPPRRGARTAQGRATHETAQQSERLASHERSANQLRALAVAPPSAQLVPAWQVRSRSSDEDRVSRRGGPPTAMNVRAACAGSLLAAILAALLAVLALALLLALVLLLRTRAVDSALV